jgi:dynein intermediate chain
MISGTKIKRAAALEEKRRRLEELKSRRNQRASDSISTSAVSASKQGNLDEYIDDLLNSAPPIIHASLATPEQSLSQSVGLSTSQSSLGKVLKIDQLDDGPTTFESTSNASPIQVTSVKPVETFHSSTQTEEDDFPVLYSREDEQDRTVDKTNEVDLSTDNEEKCEIEERSISEPVLLSEDEIKSTLISKPFYTFINSASKKVERLLGAPLLSDLLVDDATYYADKESKKDTTMSTRGKDHTFISAQVSFSFSKWTADRDITSLDWSPHHRGEMMLASYHMPSFAKSPIGSTAVYSLASSTTSSTSLFPRSKTEMTESDGLAILWNLAMPSRPEHIFICGSPVLSAKFHPTEGHLVVGACYSGQIVVWDVRNGKLPVQRSSLNILGGSAGIGGHVHPIVGLEALNVSRVVVTFEFICHHTSVKFLKNVCLVSLVL